jgi:hypothetical protein
MVLNQKNPEERFCEDGSHFALGKVSGGRFKINVQARVVDNSIEGQWSSTVRE